jgi:hypothetical protein
MLGRMKMSVQDCIQAYQDLGRVVFGKPMGPLHDHMFDSGLLEEETKKIVRERLGTDDAPLLQPLESDNDCKTHVLPF